MLVHWKKSYDKPRQHIKKQRHHFADKRPYCQSYGFSSRLVAPGHVGSSETRDKTCVPYIGRQILNSWTTREVQSSLLLLLLLLCLTLLQWNSQSAPWCLCQAQKGAVGTTSGCDQLRDWRFRGGECFQLGGHPFPVYLTIPWDWAPLSSLLTDGKKGLIPIFFSSLPQALWSHHRFFLGTKQFNDLTILSQQLQWFLISHKLTNNEIYIFFYKQKVRCRCLSHSFSLSVCPWDFCHWCLRARLLGHLRHWGQRNTQPVKMRPPAWGPLLPSPDCAFWVTQA